MKKRDLAARIDRLENAVFSRTSEGAGDDMRDTPAEIRDAIRAQDATGLPREREITSTPPPTQADGRMGAEVVMDAIKGRAPAPDADTIAWACERMQRHANSMRNFGAVVDRRDVASDLEYIAERLSGGADGGLL